MNALAGLLPSPLAQDLDRTHEPPQIVKALNTCRTMLPPPYQSRFRVIALALYEDSEGRIGHVVGANNESCCLANSLCGERAALAQLRLVEREPVRLLRMYVVTDDFKPLFPGMLCREFISSVAEAPTMPIIVAGAMGDDIRIASLGELYPYPSLYRHVGRAELLETGASLAAKGLQLPTEPAVAALYQAVLQATGRDDRDHLHPVRYAAGVLFADGSSRVSWQKKGIEYGTTIDACAALAQALEEEEEEEEDGEGRRREPRLLMQLDQHGICHAPFGATRAFLKEFGHGELRVLVHWQRGEEDSKDDGPLQLRTVSVRELTPAEPQIEFKR